MTREVWQAEINKTPLKRRADYKRSVIEHGLDSEFVADSLAHHEKLLSWMADSLKGGAYLAGEAVLCAGSTTEYGQVEGGCTKGAEVCEMMR
jgi:hypothetical protein